MREYLPPLLCGLALALALLVPEAGQWSTGFLGTDHVDAWGTQWFYWYLGEVVGGRADLAHTDLLFHPWGKDLYQHTGANLLDAVLAWPFRALLGSLPGYNLFVVVVLAANGAAATFVARRLGARSFGAALAGVTFAFHPFALSELSQGRATQALLVFATLFLGEVLAAPRWRGPWPPLRAGLLLALTAWSYWFYGFFVAMAAVLLGAIHLARSPRRGPLLGGLLIAAAVAAVATLPFAWPLLAASSSGEVPGLLDTSSWGLFEWTPVTREGFAIALRTVDPLTGKAGFHMLSDGTTRFVVEGRALSWTLLLLAAVGLIATSRRGRLPLVVVALLGLLLACGPVLEPRLGLVDPLYTTLVRVAGPFQRLWWPARALSLVAVALVPLVAAGADRLGEGWRAWPVAVLSCALLGAELALAGLLPATFTTPELPPAYRCLAEQGAPGAILELPLGPHPERLYYQVEHGRPIAAGMLEDNPLFAPPGAASLVQDNALVAFLDAATRPRGEASSAGRDFSAERAELARKGFAYVLVDRAQLSADAPDEDIARRTSRMAWVRAREALGEPVYSGEDAYVFTVEGASPAWGCSANP